MNRKIAVAGIGYVGLSLFVLLAQCNQAAAVDIVLEKVDLINKRTSPIRDECIEKYLNLTVTLDVASAYKDSGFVIIAAPTNYDSNKNFFATSAVESVIELVLKFNPGATMVIKSTISVRYTKSVREKYGMKNILFSPEFLRESKALYENLYPGRIIVGTNENDERLVSIAYDFAELLQEGAIKEDVDILFMDFTEAKVVKFFSNAYLALLVFYFKELDTYAEIKALAPHAIIKGVNLRLFYVIGENNAAGAY